MKINYLRINPEVTKDILLGALAQALVFLFEQSHIEAVKA